jgi:hypothetical protein
VTKVSATDKIPEPLRRFIAEGGSTFRCDDGDWEVNIEFPPHAILQRELPPNSLIIANNGCGDYLFLTSQDASDSEAGSFGNRVFVFWHEGAEIEQFSDDIRMLTDPHDPTPSNRGTVFYADGGTQVMLGDHVSARDLVFRKEGRIVYVPGLSRRNREFEHGGLCWVGIRFEGGAITGVIVDPDSNRLKRGVRFLSRSTSKFREIGPHENLD